MRLPCHTRMTALVLTSATFVACNNKYVRIYSLCYYKLTTPSGMLSIHAIRMQSTNAATKYWKNTTAALQ